MTTGKETLATLARELKDLGQTKKSFQLVHAGYERLKGDKRVEADLKDYRNIGTWGIDCKAHLKAIKNNPNTGLFGEFMTCHFPRLNANEISNCLWLATNWEKAKSFNNGSKQPVNNPEVLKRKIRKELNDRENTTEADYKEYGLKTPKPKASGKVEKAVEGEDKTINRKNISKLTNDETLAWLQALTNRLEEKAKNNSLQFTHIQILEIEKISLQLADLQVNVTTAIEKVKKAA